MIPNRFLEGLAMLEQLGENPLRLVILQIDVGQQPQGDAERRDALPRAEIVQPAQQPLLADPPVAEERGQSLSRLLVDPRSPHLLPSLRIGPVARAAGPWRRRQRVTTGTPEILTGYRSR